jgi:hypothetical protein
VPRREPEEGSGAASDSFAPQGVSWTTPSSHNKQEAIFHRTEKGDEAGAEIPGLVCIGARAPTAYP